MLNVIHITPINKKNKIPIYTSNQIKLLHNKFQINHKIIKFSGISLWLKPWKIIKTIIGIRKQIKSFKADLIHAHWGSLLCLVGILASFHLCKVVITFRGSDVNVLKSELKIKGFVVHFLSEIGSLLADHCIFVSLSLKKKIFFKNKNYSVIFDGVNLSLFRQRKKNSMRKLLKLKPSENVILFYKGGDSINKRLDLMMDIVDELNKLNFDHRLIILSNKLMQEEIPIYLNAADCLVFLSDFEGSPNIVREAISCNANVISRNVGDVIKYKKFIKIVTSNPNEIAKTIIKTINKKESKVKIVNFYRKLFNEERVASNIFKIYKTVIKRYN
jgi:glycosyltransferase involved in cell wall biosynthesis